MSSQNRDPFILRRITRKTIKDPKTDCWIFIGSRQNGYGVIRYQGKIHEGVHRISAMLYLDFDLNDSINQVNHRVICPHKNCWNPEHLYVGTQGQNISDAKELNLFTAKIRCYFSHCKKGHELKGHNLIVDPKTGKRRCRACKNLAWMKYYERKK